MELLFESRLELGEFQGHLNVVQNQPTIHPEPVIRPDSKSDGRGCSIYGSVLRDGGRYRMWYLAIAGDWDFGGEPASVGYAESDDGLTWRKPNVQQQQGQSAAGNYCNLGLHSGNVFIDPEAPPSHRYRATGCGIVGHAVCHTKIEERGYYTAHSADGLDWHLDEAKPRWHSSDVITNVYHPGQKRAIVAMKFTPRQNRILRRSIHTAEFSQGRYSDHVAALYPDEFDDVCAAREGHASCDYYGMGMLPAGAGTVGFLWKYWHDLPYTGYPGCPVALYGTSDMTLVYQAGPGDKWFHVPGRPTFIDHREHPWMSGWINSAGCTVDAGDEQRLYFSGVPYSHGWYLDEKWKPIERWTQRVAQQKGGGIGFASWKRDRLFGFASDPDGSFEIKLGPVARPSQLLLNCQTHYGGGVRVELLDTPGRELAQSMALSGDHLAGQAAWLNGTRIEPTNGKTLTARIHLDCARVWAYELKAL